MSRKSFPFRATGGDIRDLKQPGYYPGYSTLDQQNHWDETTRGIVTGRVKKNLPPQFFSPAETALLSAIIDRILPQDDRSAECTIPILPAIDERLAKNQLDGYRFADMPPDQDAYRMGLTAIDDMAHHRFQQSFVELTVHQQELLLKSIHDGEPDPPHPVWQRMPIHRFWALLIGDCIAAYYAHPWAWDEIGFGGPAYPRGYMRLENGEREPWEKDEHRYEWSAPVDSVSQLEEGGGPPEHSSTHGHGGTH